MPLTKYLWLNQNAYLHCIFDPSSNCNDLWNYISSFQTNSNIIFEINQDFFPLEIPI